MPQMPMPQLNSLLTNDFNFAAFDQGNEKVMKLHTKLNTLKSEQMKQELQARALGIRYSVCNYNCAAQCFTYTFPLAKLKDSFGVIAHCLVSQCRCQKSALPAVESFAQLSQYINAEVLHNNATYDWQYREKPKPQGYNVNFMCNVDCGKDCYSTLSES